MNSSTGGFPRPFRSSDPRAILPRSVSLALWLPRATGGFVSPEVAVSSVQHDDEPHVVVSRVDQVETVEKLVDFVRSLAGSVVAVGSVFPVPGDVASAPYLAHHDGVEAEEMVLVRARLSDGSMSNFALVPEVEQFGSRLEEGFTVRWVRQEIGPWEYQVLASAGSVAEATRDLRTELLTVTEQLSLLGVARSSVHHEDVVDLLRDPVDVGLFLPDDIAPRIFSLLELSARLRAIVDIARLDEGGSLSAAQGVARRDLLRKVDSVARRAMEAGSLFTPLTQ